MSVTATAKRRRREARLDKRYKVRPIESQKARLNRLIERQKEMATRKGKKK
jgi:hypothetical protein